MLEKLKDHLPEGGVRALILSPTRDLALQTLKFTIQLAKFTDVVGGNELTAMVFTERLKLFTPKQTVLETEGAAAKSKHRHGPVCQWIDVMKRKRAVHEQIIKRTQQQRSSDKATQQLSSDNETLQFSDVEDIKELKPEMVSVNRRKKKETIGSKRKERSFKDEEYFISPVPTNQHLEAGLSVRSDQDFGANRFESAVMDLVADDNKGMRKQRSVYHWDKKSKKYIKLNNGERVTASGKITTEGGQKVKAHKIGIYKKWKATTHNTISSRGTDNADNVRNTNTAQGGGRFNKRFQGGKPQRDIPNAHLASEVKDLEQIRKQRQIKETKQSYLKNRSNNGKVNRRGGDGKSKGRSVGKGSKFGKGGNKNRAK